MADLHILREHLLGFPAARKIAIQWAAHAEQAFGMVCTYEEGATADEVSFTRTGVHGTLSVTHEAFELNARLGFVLGVFKERIEREIVKTLDDLLKEK